MALSVTPNSRARDSSEPDWPFAAVPPAKTKLVCPSLTVVKVDFDMGSFGIFGVMVARRLALPRGSQAQGRAGLPAAFKSPQAAAYRINPRLCSAPDPPPSCSP